MKALRKKSELKLFALALCVGLVIIVPYQVEAARYSCSATVVCPGGGGICSCSCESNQSGACECYAFDNGCAVYVQGSHAGSCIC